jgi:hypothetical protein
VVPYRHGVRTGRSPRSAGLVAAPSVTGMTITSHTSQSDATAISGSTTRIRVVAGALGAAALTVAALLITTPWGDRYDSSADEVVDYDGLAAVRDGAWTAMLADGFAFAVLGLTLGIVTCHLVRGRGRVAALAGAVLTTAGGILFAMGGMSFATLTWFASGVSEDAGRSLVDYANDNTGHLLGAAMAGFLLFTVGGLVLATALFRARAVPAAGLAAYALLVLAQFAPLPGRTLDYLQVAMMALFVALAVRVLRRATA